MALTQAVDEVLAAFNELADRQYRTGAARNKSHVTFIGGRLKEELAAPDTDIEAAVFRAKAVIRHAVFLWGDDVKMHTYIRPSTLFAPGKWADRIDEARRWIEQGGTR